MVSFRNEGVQLDVVFSEQPFSEHSGFSCELKSVVFVELGLFSQIILHIGCNTCLLRVGVWCYIMGP